MALLVEGAEIAAVERDVLGVLARQHGVGLGPGGDQDRARRQHHLLARMLIGLREVAADLRRGVPGHPQRRGLLEQIDLDRDRGQHLGEADPLLHRLRHLLVVEGVARRIDEAAAIGDRDPAPGIDQPREARCAALASRHFALGADRAGMGDELLGALALGAVPFGAHRLGAALGDQRLVARRNFSTCSG